MNPHKVVLSTLAVLTILFLGAAAMSFWSEITLSREPDVLKSGPSHSKFIPYFVDIPVTETGVIAVRASTLHQLNFQFAAFSQEFLTLTHDGVSVPFLMDPSLQYGTLFFYGQASESDLEPTAVYRLQIGKGAAIQTQKAAPTGTGTDVGIFHHRWQQASTQLAQVSSNNLWLGQLLLAPHQWQLSLEQLQSTSKAATISLQVWSNTEDSANPDHHLELLINDQPIESWYWDGVQETQLIAEVPENVLRPLNANIITISTPGDTGAIAESVYINQIDLFYERELTLRGRPLRFESAAENITMHVNDTQFLILNITDPTTPTRVTNYQQAGSEVTFSSSEPGSRYLALYPYSALEPRLRVSPDWRSRLQQTERGADYIAIVPEHDGFQNAIQPLLAYREAQGLRVTAVSLDQIYDEFAAGEHSPAAIREFLTYAATNWQPPAPRFVLLVGDASYDIHAQTSGKNKNIIPTYLYPNSSDTYQISDAWFVMLDGDNAPDMAIGRFPAQTFSQVEEMVYKTIAYELDGDDNWQSRALFVADDELQFNTASNILAQKLEGNGYDIYKLYMTEDDDIHYDIIGALSKGVGLVNYTGHGQEAYWGDEAVFHVQDSGMLANSGRFPILTAFTCNNGAFGSPTIDSLAEGLLWVENGGVVAAIAAADNRDATHHLQLADHFFQQQFLHQAPTLGEALMAAKTAVSTNPSLQDTIHAVHLLGDPALVLQRPEHTLHFYVQNHPDN
jgi:hypothetical protein